MWELPPRARRIRKIMADQDFQTGTTSACAENTGRNANRLPYPRNYLRVRGEYQGRCRCVGLSVELPPRARRIQSRAGPALTAGGTTSACAENTLTWGCFVARIRNYLRVRGEYLGGELHNLPRQELPPRARRIRVTCVALHALRGTTSACAENTSASLIESKVTRNYLRVRGEYHRHPKREIRVLELPPRARRIPHTRHSPGAAIGTTSACAENTYEVATTSKGSGNYLRVRGEYLGLRRLPGAPPELPPRARRIP